MYSFSNKEISEMLSEYTDLMEIVGENKYRVRAYDNASRILSDRTIELEKLVKEDNLEEIKGIGEGIAQTIKDIYEKGFCEPLEELRKQLPPGFEELLNIPGLGPKTAGRFLEELEIENLEDLKQALQDKKIRELKGFGAKTEENLLEALKEYKEYTSYINLDKALDVSNKIIEQLKEQSSEILDIDTAGSTRRKKIKIGDLDILISVKDKKSHTISDSIKELKIIKDIILEGDTKISARTNDGLQVDFRIVNQDEYPAALLYFTGSKYHNVRLRQLAKERDLKLNEYGVFEGEKRLEVNSEIDIYKLFDLKYIEPELREDKGEIEAAQNDKLPDLITIDDIKGDFHVHSNYSDGSLTIEEMVKAAKDRGYNAIAFTDHSQSLNIANGLSEEEVKKQWKEIEEVRKDHPDFLILKGIEVDIKKDGSLDYRDEILKGFDIVIASVHSNFNLSKDEMTARIIKAAKNPYVTILGHPTGRMLGQRQPFDFDFEKVLEVVKENNVILEINSSPSRFDLDDEMAYQALKSNVKLTINTDSHHSDQLSYMNYGVYIARRAWAKPEDIVNTYSNNKLKELFEVN